MYIKNVFKSFLRKKPMLIIKVQDMHSAPEVFYDSKHHFAISDVDFKYKTQTNKIEDGGLELTLNYYNPEALKNNDYRLLQTGFRTGYYEIKKQKRGNHS